MMGEVLPIKLRSEKTMQSKSGGKNKGERERERCGHSLRKWNDQNDGEATAKHVAVASTSTTESMLQIPCVYLQSTTAAVK